MTEILSDHFAFTPREWKRYCTHCRIEEEDEKKLLQCTRCKNAFYCSRDCQKNNWTMHKRICKKLNSCASDYDDACKLLEVPGTTEERSKDDIDKKMEASTQFAPMLIDHAYFSTDTIPRGAVIYEKAMRMLLWCVDRSCEPFQNVQYLLVLATCLEYDQGVLTLIDILSRRSDPDAEKEAVVVPEFSMDPSFDYKGEGVDLVYACLLLIHLRRLTQYRDQNNDETSSDTRMRMEENVRVVMDLCVNRCKWLLECLPPDGDPLSPDAANDLFGRLTCWQLIKDSFALTPGLMDVFLEFCPLERSIR